MSSAVYRTIAEAAEDFGPCALAIGNFDGVHVGHAALLQAAVRYASERGLRPAVLTFDPHPSAVVAPERTPQMLCTLEERVQLLLASGIERVMILPFTQELSRLSPRDFVQQIVVAALRTKAVFVGNNFRFGHKQSGDTAVLEALGAELGFRSQFLEAVQVRGVVVSSSVIRQNVQAGQVSRAGRLLGRCFAVGGPVVSGQGIGSKRTVPTLNLRPEPGLALPLGVFVTETFDLKCERRWPSITNVGVRPTFGGEDITVETYLLGPLEDESPEAIRVDFRHFIREERKFENPEQLRSQILRDVARANSYWARIAGPSLTIY